MVEADNLDGALAVAQELQDTRTAARSRWSPSGEGSSVALDAVFRNQWGRVLATLVASSHSSRTPPRRRS
jgi:hypothetical protein